MNTVSSNRIQKLEAGVRPLSTVLKALEIIELFSNRSRPMRLSDVAREMGLSRGTAFQRLVTLVSAGLLEQDEDGRYRLSMYAVRLAAAALEQANLGMRVEPALARLVSQARETASLAVLDRGLPCIVARVESDSLLRADQKLGTMLSLDGSASGRVLVAFADEVTLDRLRQGEFPLPPEDVLEAARRNGYAVSSGYTQNGVRGIAAPVFDSLGRCHATVSLVTPEMRFNLDLLKAPVVNAAADITRIFHGEPLSDD
mgnify:FL=1|tara:strand:+ start:29809 stop:30579 length:771 start_codon:yes stop_codon:yes gene_type:complete